MDILSEVKKIESGIIALYRKIHANPELSHQEVQTARTVVDALAPLGLKVRTGVAGTGVVADMRIGEKCPTVAFRADMDALAIQEETGLDFASKRAGVMHACGHDSHIAMLVGAARVLSAMRSELKANVRFIFQPAEEQPPGAGFQVVAEGALDGVNEVYAIHVVPYLDSGVVACRAGPFMAAVDDFSITVKGRGGHAARPHETVDPVLTAARLIVDLQSIASRMTDPVEPVVLSVCMIEGGTAYNIIPGEVRMRGTVRTMSEKLHKDIPELIRRMADGVCRSAGADFELSYNVGYPVTVNDPEAVGRVGQVVGELFGPEPGMYGEQLRMGAEDFSYFLQRVPGALISLGIRNQATGATHPNHNPKFRVDESALWKGTALFAGLALRGRREAPSKKRAQENIRIECGDGFLEIPLGDGRYVGRMEPWPCAAVGNVADAVEESLARPVGSKPFGELLRRARKMLLLTVDHTRPSPRELMLPLLEAAGRAGVRAEVLVGTGTHRKMTDGELHRHFGREILTRFALHQHVASDAAAHIELGQTSRGTPIRVNRMIFDFDLVAAVGWVEPTYLMGFSGGRKILLPAIAHAQAVENNHFYINDPAARIGVTKGNPLSDDSDEFGEKLPLHWITQAVVGPQDEITAVVSGDRRAAFEEACRLSAEIFRVRRVEADVIVASSGGRPYDVNLVQGKKALVAAIEAVRLGGCIILAAAAPEGTGSSKTFTQWITSMKPEEIVEHAARREEFSLAAHGARIFALPYVRKSAQVVLVTGKKLVEDLRGAFFHVTDSPEEASRIAREICGDAAEWASLHKGRRIIVS